MQGDKCSGSGDPISSGNESLVPGWKPHGSGRSESHRRVEFQDPKSGSSHSRTAVISSGSSFVGISAQLSAVGRVLMIGRLEKKEKNERGKHFCDDDVSRKRQKQSKDQISCEC